MKKELFMNYLISYACMIIAFTCHGAASDEPRQTPSHYPKSDSTTRCKGLRIIHHSMPYVTATKEDDHLKYTCIVMDRERPQQQLKSLADELLASAEEKTDRNDFGDICARSLGMLQTPSLHMALLVKISKVGVDRSGSLFLTADGTSKADFGSSVLNAHIVGCLRIGSDITLKEIEDYSNAAIKATAQWYDIVLDFRTKKKTCLLL